MDNLIDINPASKVIAADAMAKSISFCLERRYLCNLTKKDSIDQYFSLNLTPYNYRSNPISWIRIKQIGKPLEDRIEDCFSSIQKILYSLYLPGTQLLFLLAGDKNTNSIFLGIRSQNIHDSSIFIENIQEFIKGIWPGIDTELTNEQNSPILQNVKTEFQDGKLNNVIAFTGIPSMESQYETLYPATIDKLISGMNKKRYAYLVVASPIDNDSVDSMLYQCRDIEGRAESLKQLTISDNYSNSIGDVSSETRTLQETISHSISRKDYGGAAIAKGLGLSKACSPVVSSVIDGLGAAAVSILKISSKELPILGVAGSLLDGLAGQKSENKSISQGTSYGTQHSKNETAGQTIGATLCNKHIEAISKQLSHHAERLEAGKSMGLWEVGVYLASETRQEAEGGANLLRSIFSGNESFFEPIRTHDLTDILIKEDDARTRATIQSHVKRKNLDTSLGMFRNPQISIKTKNGTVFNHPLGPEYNSLMTVLTTKELSYMVNFPLRTVPGISVVDSSAEFSLNPINNTQDCESEFGKMIYGGTRTTIGYQLSVDSLAKHVLLCGINGTGKTNTVQSILNNIAGKMPFLIIEPAKTEYVDWASEYNRRNPNHPINIFMPNCKRYRDNKCREIKLKDLHINPFEIVWLSPEQEPNVWSHIDRVKASFASAFPMYDILPVLLEKLIYATYQSMRNCKWIGSGIKPVYNQTLFPTLDLMSVLVDDVIDKIGYEKQIASNMKACLNTRIDNLRGGWRGKMLNTEKSTPWEELFRSPCVINLSYVGDDVDKSFIMSLILQFMYEFCQAKAELRDDVNYNDNRCRHLTIIEEAHRVMMKCDNPEMPQYKTAMTFSNMLSEIRAYGEGLFLVDQVPTRLIPDAIKNTNTKIVHRLVSEDDCRSMAESMALSEDQKKMIPKLLVGQCIISTALTTDKHWVMVNKSK